ncbi:MAG TPA: 6,7-dimethyl-8-ribityllumazine synthase [Candidatus Omnitrophota bacterium]|nr:6,7-dimethyl-8-ribityllumazine synthase [Candidatus Omnitrophota bacterium]
MVRIKTTKFSRPEGSGKRIAIVASEFNGFITKRLLKACLAQLTKCGVREKDVTVCWVPGSYELPLTALTLAKKKNIHAVICLGCVIRGETFHFELVAQGAARGIMEASLMSGKPVIFAVLTTDTLAQAKKRSQEKGDNKGLDAAVAAVHMANLMQRINT